MVQNTEISESDTRNDRGTTITLFIDDDSKEFLDEFTVRGIINKYCSFLPVEIYLEDVERLEREAKEAEEKAKNKRKMEKKRL